MPPYAVRDLVTATTVTLGLIFHMLYLIIHLPASPARGPSQGLLTQIISSVFFWLLALSMLPMCNYYCTHLLYSLS